MLDSLEAVFKGQFENILKGQSFVKSAYVAKSIVEGFELYLRTIGVGETGIDSISLLRLFNDDILSFNTVPGDITKELWKYGINVMNQAVQETLTRLPFETLQEKVVTAEIVYQRLALLLYNIVRRKNSELLEGINFNPKPDANLSQMALASLSKYFPYLKNPKILNVYFSKN